MKTKIQKECTCEKCVRACSNTPGWFRPGEAEKAARLLKVPLKTFFKKYCGVNWWCGNGRDVFVLAPAITSMDAGHEYPGNPKGTCVFFENNRCLIHSAKPHDCRVFNVCEDSLAEKERRKKDRQRTVSLWRKEQKQITALLGRKPQAESLSIFDAFSGMFF